MFIYLYFLISITFADDLVIQPGRSRDMQFGYIDAEWIAPNSGKKIKGSVVSDEAPVKEVTLVIGDRTLSLPIPQEDSLIGKMDFYYEKFKYNDSNNREIKLKDLLGNLSNNVKQDLKRRGVDINKESQIVRLANLKIDSNKVKFRSWDRKKSINIEGDRLGCFWVPNKNYGNSKTLVISSKNPGKDCSKFCYGVVNCEDDTDDRVEAACVMAANPDGSCPSADACINDNETNVETNDVIKDVLSRVEKTNSRQSQSH